MGRKSGPGSIRMPVFAALWHGTGIECRKAVKVPPAKAIGDSEWYRWEGAASQKQEHASNS